MTPLTRSAARLGTPGGAPDVESIKERVLACLGEIYVPKLEGGQEKGIHYSACLTIFPQSPESERLSVVNALIGQLVNLGCKLCSLKMLLVCNRADAVWNIVVRVRLVK